MPVPARALPRTTRNRCRAHKIALRRGAFALWLLLIATEVFAQVSGTATLVSDYRFRGLSLSENNPAAQFGVAYDGAQGWYAGAFASTVDFAAASGSGLQAVPYVGYALRTDAGLTWEAGADYSAFTGSARYYNYPEAYVGVASDRLSGRLYYSSHYFGENIPTLYGEVNATQPLFDRVRLLAHFGMLRDTDGNLYYRGPERLLDGRVGIGLDFDKISVQLSWVGINSSDATYGITGVKSRNGPLLTLTWSF